MDDAFDCHRLVLLDVPPRVVTWVQSRIESPWVPHALMGENLFLSSYRFGTPLSEVYRSVLPFGVILAAAVLAITYVPWLTLWLVGVYDQLR